MQYRSPTAADIGKTVEARDYDSEDWKTITLASIDYDDQGPPLFWERVNERLIFYRQCRVPVHSPDPVAELYVAADMLADNGLDEAARVLMLYPQLLEAIDRIVIDEGIDAGVILLDGESRTQWNNELQRSEYTNPFFSQLGEALVMLSRMIKGNCK